MKADVTTVKTRIAGLEAKVNQAERYQRRWNLRLYGLQEQEGEDDNQRMIDICRAIVPEIGDSLCFHVDVSKSGLEEARVGRKNGDKIRPVITRFISRSKNWYGKMQRDPCLSCPGICSLVKI